MHNSFRRTHSSSQSMIFCKRSPSILSIWSSSRCKVAPKQIIGFFNSSNRFQELYFEFQRIDISLIFLSISRSYIYISVILSLSEFEKNEASDVQPRDL